MPLTLNVVKASGEKKLSVQVESDDCTVEHLKQKIFHVIDADKSSKLTLIFAGKILKDEEKLSKYKVQDGATLHLVVKSGTTSSNATAAPSTAPSTTTPATAPPATNTTPPHAFQPDPNNIAGPQLPPLPMLFPGMSSFGAAGDQNDPLMSQVQNMMNNPQAMQQVMADPLFQQMMQSMMQNPQMMSESPFLSGNGAANPAMANPQLLQSLLGGMGGMGGQIPPPQSNVPPEELYQGQLAQLSEMGFYNASDNIRALQATGGNVNAAIERLLSGL